MYVARKGGRENKGLKDKPSVLIFKSIVLMHHLRKRLAYRTKDNLWVMEADFEGIRFKGVQIRWHKEHERSYLGDWQKEN